MESANSVPVAKDAQAERDSQPAETQPQPAEGPLANTTGSCTNLRMPRTDALESDNSPMESAHTSCMISPVSSPHSLSKADPISIPAKPVSQPPSHSQPREATSPSTPPLGTPSETPPREGILSRAARAALEGRRASSKDAACHSPSPSRRRPPLSPSSSSGALTPPKSMPSPKPQNMFYNPYVRKPNRVTGFSLGSPRAPVAAAQLSAETENELLQATQRGLFSDDDMAASDQGGGTLDGGRQEAGPLMIPEDSSRGVELTKDVGREAESFGGTATREGEAELETRKRKSEESPETVRGPVEVRGPFVRVDSSQAGPESEDASHSSSSLQKPSLQAETAASPNLRNPEADFAAGVSELGSPPIHQTENSPAGLGSFSPLEPESSAVSHLPSSDAGTKRSARDRWRRARLHVAAARAFAYSSGGGFSEVTEAETGGGHPKPELDTAEGPVNPAAPLEPAATDSIVRTASIAPSKSDAPSSDVPQDKGRRRFEGIQFIEQRSWLVVLSDLYIAVLKAPILLFLVVIFLFPALLCLFFVPLYLLDLRGLQCDDCKPPLPSASFDQLSTPSAAHSLCHVLLYSLSLSMLFGGSPVEAHSRYTLLVANLQTLAANFTFVFLSGAVFSRMSQRSQPVQCARKAVIRPDDVTTVNDGVSERFRVFMTRLVLKGPMPAVLVDVHIKLTFRIFVEQRNGSLFCSTAALELVRPEVAYLQYGIQVKHVIDRGSPLYGHTRESLLAGDASFSLTILGTERASLQSIFHMQEYFMADSDIVWDGDFSEIMAINSKGIRVIDHSKLDTLSVFRSAAQVPRAIMRMRNLVRLSKSESSLKAEMSQKAEPTNETADRPHSRASSLEAPGTRYTKATNASTGNNGQWRNLVKRVGSRRFAKTEGGQAGNAAPATNKLEQSSDRGDGQGSGEACEKGSKEVVPGRPDQGGAGIGGVSAETEEKHNQGKVKEWERGETSARGKGEEISERPNRESEEEAEAMVGDVLGGFTGPASDFGGGIRREELQTLRQRKIDQQRSDGQKSARSNASESGGGTSSKARRYNMGF